jgi:two-component system, sensor histidine kinase and response regulator
MYRPDVSSSPAAPIDLRYLRVIVETDRSFLEELVAVYLTASPDYCQALHAAIMVNNAAAFTRVAHSLKGALGSIGATPAAGLAATLEILGGTAGLEEIAPALTQLEQELARVAAVFDEPGWWEEALRREPAWPMQAARGAPYLASPRRRRSPS